MCVCELHGGNLALNALVRTRRINIGRRSDLANSGLSFIPQYRRDL
jgi:hypothetical protein